MGIPNEKISALGLGEPFAKTLAGPPDKTIPTGLNLLMSPILVLKGNTFE